MSMGTLIVFLDLTVVNTALPAISVDLGASTSDLQWTVDAYVLPLPGLLLLAGSIGDRFGRRRWMNVGLVTFLGGSVLAALADSVGVLVAGRAVQGLVFGIIQASEQGWASSLVTGSLVSAIVLLGAFGAVERRSEHPMLPLGFFARRNFTGPVIIIGLMFFAGPATFFFMTQFFQIVQGRSPFEAGLLILPSAGAILVASAMAPGFTQRFGPRRTVVIGTTIMAVAMVGFTRSTPAGTPAARSPSSPCSGSGSAWECRP